MADYCKECDGLLDDDGDCGECEILGHYFNGGEPSLEHYDNVGKPFHYNQTGIECIDYIKDFLNDDELTGYFRGNIAKYLHRWRYKNKQEDLLKSQWYLDRLIKLTGKADV